MTVTFSVVPLLIFQFLHFSPLLRLSSSLSSDHLIPTSSSCSSFLLPSSFPPPSILRPSSLLSSSWSSSSSFFTAPSHPSASSLRSVPASDRFVSSPPGAPPDAIFCDDEEEEADNRELAMSQAVYRRWAMRHRNKGEKVSYSSKQEQVYTKIDDGDKTLAQDYRRDMLKLRPNILNGDEHPNDLSKVEAMLGMDKNKSTQENNNKEQDKEIEKETFRRHQYKRNDEGVPEEKLSYIVRQISKEGKPPVQLFKPPPAEEVRTLTKQGRKRRGMNDDKYRWLLTIGAGKRKGRKLRSPGVYLRPMMAKVKGSIFSMLSRLGMFDSGANIRVLDLYSGSGSVAIEALSRGAAQATLVDNSQDCCETAGYNMEMCRFDGRIVRATVEEVLRFPAMFSLYEPFDLVFACPPYQEVVYGQLIQVRAIAPRDSVGVVC
eukprot:GHVS01088097.1.p1 GENE.GHVS01088097.1~~GHVS01088097.1.p1  ORF type:complete len:432 (-),score=75.02 GHVS01088097.1:381-1676(-)